MRFLFELLLVVICVMLVRLVVVVLLRWFGVDVNCMCVIEFVSFVKC